MYTSRYYSLILVAAFVLLPFHAFAQERRLTSDVEYKISAEGAMGSGDIAPFWFTNNRYGMGTLDNTSGIVRGSIIRNAEADSLRRWHVGYGLDVAGVFSENETRFALQQAFVDIQWEAIRISLGQKERMPELKNRALSTGGLTLGSSARPIPQARFELPEFWNIPGTRGWLAIKGHLAYGWYTDHKWQENNNDGTLNKYTSGSLYHSKAGFMRIGNKDKFPLTLIGGLEMASQFGGKAYNITKREGGYFDEPQSLPHGPKAYFDALILGGSDVNDGDEYANVAGNHLGSWHLRLDYHGKGWKVGAYAEHQFEDHSQMFMQYAWKDMLYGLEVNLPKNPFVSNVVMEHLRTTHQSGPIYHDHTEAIPDQISARDNYYNNHVYGAWQNYGFVMGNPLLISPLYNNRGISPGVDSHGKLHVMHNRVTACHVGISGQPHADVTYRVLYTHEKSLGSYANPAVNPLKGNYILAECSYRPHKLKYLGFKVSYGHNDGDLLGKTNAGMLTLDFSGWINKTNKY